MSCPHLNFKVHANVIRLKQDDHVPDDAPVHHYTMDVRVECKDCAKPFVFVGLPAGASMGRPMCSVDGKEGRFPIGPEGAVATVLDGAMEFTVRRTI